MDKALIHTLKVGDEIRVTKDVPYVTKDVPHVIVWPTSSDGETMVITRLYNTGFPVKAEGQFGGYYLDYEDFELVGQDKEESAIDDSVGTGLNRVPVRVIDMVIPEDGEVQDWAAARRDRQISERSAIGMGKLGDKVIDAKEWVLSADSQDNPNLQFNQTIAIKYITLEKSLVNRY